MSFKKKIASIGLAAGMLTSMIGGTGIAANAASPNSDDIGDIHLVISEKDAKGNEINDSVFFLHSEKGEDEKFIQLQDSKNGDGSHSYEVWFTPEEGAVYDVFQIVKRKGTAAYNVDLAINSNWYLYNEVKRGNGSNVLLFVDFTSYLYGDVNKDGVVNTADIAKLQQYLAGWNVHIPTTAESHSLFSIADVNLDSKINAADVAKLQQYLAGWNVTLGGNDVFISNKEFYDILKKTLNL